MSLADDLSDYERLRIENIRRNAEFLAGLGITENKPASNGVSPHVEKTKSVGKRKREDSESRKSDSQPTRRSARVQLLQNGIKLEEDEVELREEVQTKQKSYDDLPFDSEDLDDYEFQVYVALKAWRLQKCRELDLEPYKICQNRTLAELVRRRRSASDWASSSMSEEERENRLLECWGIGPSKAKKDGYGDLLMQVIDNNEKLLDFLEKSREYGDNFPQT